MKGVWREVREISQIHLAFFFSVGVDNLELTAWGFSSELREGKLRVSWQSS